MTDIDRQFVAAARTYLGVPWMEQGRTRAGVDCIGLVVLAARDCGLPVPLTANYGRMQAYGKMKPLLIEWCDRRGEGGEGIVVLYKNDALLHLGILTGTGTVIHAYGPNGRVIESGLFFTPMQFWRPKWPF